MSLTGNTGFTIDNAATNNTTTAINKSNIPSTTSIPKTANTRTGDIKTPVSPSIDQTNNQVFKGKQKESDPVTSLSPKTSTTCSDQEDTTDEDCIIVDAKGTIETTVPQDNETTIFKGRKSVTFYSQPSTPVAAPIGGTEPDLSGVSKALETILSTIAEDGKQGPPAFGTPSEGSEPSPDTILRLHRLFDH